VGREAVNDLTQAIDRELGDVYRQFREAWVTLYTRVETTMDTLERLQQTVPPLRAVSLPRAELEAIDQRARQLDDALRGVRDRVSSAVEPVTSAVQALVDGLHRAEDGVSALAESVSSFESRFQGMRAAVLDARSTALGWLTAGAIALTLVFVYLALAHVALVAFGWGYLQRLALARRSASLAATDSRVSP
jgi:DNA repair ATPase RecN